MSECCVKCIECNKPIGHPWVFQFINLYLSSNSRHYLSTRVVQFFSSIINRTKFRSRRRERKKDRCWNCRITLWSLHSHLLLLRSRSGIIIINLLHLILKLAFVWEIFSSVFFSELLFLLIHLKEKMRSMLKAIKKSLAPEIRWRVGSLQETLLSLLHKLYWKSETAHA